MKNTKKAVKWSSSNNKVATVRDGKVTGKKSGTAVITAKVGKEKLSCKVRVIKCYDIDTTYKYLNKYLQKRYKQWKYVAFDHEMEEVDGKYRFTIRYQGGKEANTLAGLLYVNPTSGKAVFESLWDTKEVWKILTFTKGKEA